MLFPFSLMKKKEIYAERSRCKNQVETMLPSALMKIIAINNKFYVELKSAFINLAGTKTPQNS